MEPLAVVVLVALVAALITRVVGEYMDVDRIKNYFSARGAELLESKPNWYGPGWYGNNGARIYRIRYKDKLGNLHSANLKTAMFSGVYLNDDQIIQYANSPKEELD